MRHWCWLALVVAAATIHAARAQEPDIERLLKKLPPPETLVKSQITPGVRLSDPIFQDRLGLEMNKALARKDASRALGLARKLSARHPKSALGHFLRGSLALAVRQFSEASAAFRQATSLEPRFAQAHLGLGVVEIQQARFAAALPHIQRSTQLDPKLLDGWILQSACGVRLGRKEESVRAARRATSLAPNSAVAWRQLASAENASGHRAEAARAMDKANLISPYLDPRIPRPVDALPALRRAAHQQPKNSGVHFELGYTLFDAGQPNEAIVALRKSVGLNPKFGPAWQQLGRAYRKLGRHREANAAFAEADRLMPHVVAIAAEAARQRRANLSKERTGASDPTAKARRRQ